MDDVRCAWDRGKAAANLRQRRVAFEEAQTAFLDDHAPMIGDPDHSADEARFVLRGLTASLRMLVVVHPPDRRRCDRKRRPQSADVSACDAREQGLNLAAE